MKETPKQKKARIAEAETLRLELKRLQQFLSGVDKRVLIANTGAVGKAKTRIEEINSRLIILNVR